MSKFTFNLYQSQHLELLKLGGSEYLRRHLDKMIAKRQKRGGDNGRR